MKRKVFSIFLSFLLVLASVLTLAACNNDNDTDKALNNKDFIEYRKKIVTVLKDNGIFVNDLDSTARTASALNFPNAVMSATPSADGAQSGSIQDIMLNSDYVADRADYEFALKQVFGMSLKMSLCLGDGISNYFGETAFFDIPVNLNGSYISVSQNGDVSTVHAYSPNTAGTDTFDTIALDFKSADNYSFTSTSINDGFMYATGNAQKEFLVVFDSEVIYSPNGLTFYSTDKSDVVDACIALLDENALNIDKDEFYALKTNVRYTFNESQTSTLFDKYFKDIQSSTGKIEGMQYRTDGGIRYAESYVAVHNETEVEIPAGTEYISDRFVVHDQSGTVKSLYIPKSVKGIVQISDPKTGQNYDTPHILNTGINADNFMIDLAEEGQGSHKVFERIGVENGSPLFKSGNGHLQALDGTYLYIADIPFEQFDELLYDENLISQMHEGLESGYYKNLFSLITSMDIDFDADYYTSQIFDRFYHELGTLFTNLQNVSVHGRYKQNFGARIDLSVFKDITVEVNFEGEFIQENSLNSLCFNSGDNRNHNVTVNLHGFSLLADVTADGVDVTVNIEVAEALYACSYILPPQTNGNVTLKYADATLTEAQKYLGYELHNRDGKNEVMAKLQLKEEHQGGIVIPESLGIDVTALMLYNSDALEYVQFGSHIKYLIFNNDYDNSIAYNVKFDGNYADFEKIQIICYGTSYAFNLVCDDRQEFISGGKTIPEDEQCTITVKYTNYLGQPATLVIEHAKGRELNYITSSELMCGGSYVIVNSDNLIAGTVSIGDSNPENFYNFGISISKSFITGDETFTIINEPERVEQNVNLSADGFTFTGVFDGWGMINNVSISIQFDGYKFVEDGAYIQFDEFGMYNSGEIMYSSQIARFSLSLKLTGSGYIITLESFTVETDPLSVGKQ